MDLTCPSCLAKLRIDGSKIPPQGAWARCPKCREKFVARVQGQGLLDDPGAGNKRAPQNLNRPRTPEEERLLKRLAQNRPQPPQNARDFVEMPVIYPESSSRLSPGCVLALVLPAVAAALVLLVSLQMAATPPKQAAIELPAVGAAAPQPATYTRLDFDRDIMSIRRNIDRNNYNSYIVTGASPERRALLYLLNSCAPVPDLFILESIHIEPSGQQTSLNGLTATFSFSQRLNRRLYLSFNESLEPSRCF